MGAIADERPMPEHGLLWHALAWAAALSVGWLTVTLAALAFGEASLMALFALPSVAALGAVVGCIMYGVRRRAAGRPPTAEPEVNDLSQTSRRGRSAAVTLLLGVALVVAVGSALLAAGTALALMLFLVGGGG